MANEYTVTQFAIDQAELDQLVNSDDKKDREEVAEEVRKNEL